MQDLRAPSFDPPFSHLAYGVLLYAAVMMSLLIVRHLATHGSHRLRTAPRFGARLPGPLVGITIAAGAVVALDGVRSMLGMH